MRIIDRIFFVVTLQLTLFCCASLHAAQVLLKDGRVLHGDEMTMARVNETPLNASEWEGKARTMLMVDDGLRRTFVSRLQVADIVATHVEESLERFQLKRPHP